MDLSQSMVDCLVALHRWIRWRPGWADLGKGAGDAGRQVAGWSKRYRAAKTDNVPDFEAVMAWWPPTSPPMWPRAWSTATSAWTTWCSTPRTSPCGRCWTGRWRTLGDPLMDLGCAMAYWVQADDDEGLQMARRQPATHRACSPGRSSWIDTWQLPEPGLIADWTFYEVFGIFRLAVIAQQIYYRYHHGQTHNPAFETSTRGSPTPTGAAASWRVRLRLATG